MASVIYNSFFEDLLNGGLGDLDASDVRVMLVNGTYAAIADETKKDSHTRRSDIGANEVTGTGYTAGGPTATVGITRDNANNRVELALGGASWATSTITAAGAVYYRSRGGAATADELIAFIDFGGNVTSSAGTFSLTGSTLRIAN